MAGKEACEVAYILHGQREVNRQVKEAVEIERCLTPVLPPAGAFLARKGRCIGVPRIRNLLQALTA